jgi:hypothetical protein
VDGLEYASSNGFYITSVPPNDTHSMSREVYIHHHGLSKPGEEKFFRHLTKLHSRDGLIGDREKRVTKKGVSFSIAGFGGCGSLAVVSQSQEANGVAEEGLPRLSDQYWSFRYSIIHGIIM